MACLVPTSEGTACDLPWLKSMCHRWSLRLRPPPSTRHHRVTTKTWHFLGQAHMPLPSTKPRQTLRSTRSSGHDQLPQHPRYWMCCGFLSRFPRNGPIHRAGDTSHRGRRDPLLPSAAATQLVHRSQLVQHLLQPCDQFGKRSMFFGLF